MAATPAPRQAHSLTGADAALESGALFAIAIAVGYALAYVLLAVR